MIESPVVSIHIPRRCGRWSTATMKSPSAATPSATPCTRSSTPTPASPAGYCAATASCRTRSTSYLGAISIRARDGVATPITTEEVISIVPRTTRVIEGEISVG